MDIFRVLLLILVVILLAIVALHDPIAISNDSTAAPTAGSCEGEYTLAAGETLASIAIRCGLSTSEIKQVNPDRGDLDHIQAGDTITLPGKGVFPGVAEHCPVCREEPDGEADLVVYSPENVQEYIVLEGDTLDGIARKFHTNINTIRRLNLSLSGSQEIYPDQILFVPQG